MKRLSNKRKIQKQLIKRATEIGQDDLGLSHRNHRTKAKGSGGNKTINLKKDKIKKFREEERYNLINFDD